MLEFSYLKNLIKKTKPEINQEKSQENPQENSPAAKKDETKNEKGNKENKENLDQLFEQEILPLVNIFKPGDMKAEEYQRQILSALREDTEEIQNRENRAAQSGPAETVADMKKMLAARVQQILDDFYRYEHVKSEAKPNDEMVKKARIFKLAEGDSSDWDKFRKIHSATKDINNCDSQYLYSTYFKAKEEYGYSLKDKNHKDNRFNAVEINGLMKAGLTDSLTRLSFREHEEMIRETPSELLNAISHKLGKGYRISDLLGILKDEYPQDTFNALLAEGETHALVKHINLFEKAINEDDIKKLFAAYDPGYPYNLKNLLESINKLNYSSDKKKNLIDFTYKHQFVNEYRDDLDETDDKELKEKYEGLKNKIDKIVIDDSRGWRIIKPEEATQESIGELKKIISDGYVTFFYNHDEYLKYFAKTDYDWLIGEIVKHNQENLLLNKIEFKPDDLENYAQKLIKENKIDILENISERGNFPGQALSSEVCSVLLDRGYGGSLKSFGNLNEDIFSRLKEKYSEKFSGKVLFNNIGKFVFKNTTEYQNYKNYQDLVSFVKEKFGADNMTEGLYLGLNLDIDNPENNNIKKREEEITKRFEVLKKYLLEFYPYSNKGKETDSNRLNNFRNDYGFSMLGRPADDLDKYLQTFKYLPKGISPNTSYASSYFSLAERIKNFSTPEQSAFGKTANNIERFFSFNNLKRERDLKTFSDQGDTHLFDLLIKIGESNNLVNLDENYKKELSEIFSINIDDLKPEEKNSVFLMEKIDKKLGESFVRNRTATNFSGYGALKEDALNGNLSREDDTFTNKFLHSYIKESYYSNKYDYLSGVNSNQLADELKNNHEQKWAHNLTTYINIMEGDNNDEAFKNKTNALFSGPYRDFCLKEMNGEWKNFLNDQDRKELPLRLSVIAATIDYNGGAGNLKYVEILGDLMNKTGQALENKKTTPRTALEIKQALAKSENRFDKEKWSQDDKAEFYNLAQEIIGAAPSLFSAFDSVFDQLSPKEMKIFAKEILPLVQVELITLQDVKNDEGEITYKPRDLVNTRRAIKIFASRLKVFPEEKESAFKEEKERLAGVMKINFKDRFGLQKIPDNLDKENLRSIQNCIRFTGNINGRNPEREALIAFYLGLELNGQWSKWRQGEDIKPETYLSDDKYKLIKSLLDAKMANNIPLDIANIKAKDLPRFQEILQEDVLNNMIGSIETVDIKLGNVKRNIESLRDPDTYDNETDKKTVKVLEENGKLVGSVLAKTYSEANGKNIVLSSEEKKLQVELAQIFNISAWTTENVKNIQDRIQPFSLVSNVINKLEEEKVDEHIKELSEKLAPTENIINIFNRLNENFKPESGAMALRKDLEYLNELVVKDEAKLKPGEKEEIREYLNAIREKIVELESIFQKTKEYYEKIKKSAHFEDQPILQDRLKEIEKVIYASGDETMIVSRATKDLNLIIENMRQCLGCMRREINNDTNLAFGEYNKFFLMTQKEKEKGSVADEIVFFVPTQTASGKKEMSFVMDRVYGSSSSNILVSHVLTMYKKQQMIKNEFKDAHVSLTVSNEAILSVGLNQELLAKKLEEKIPGIKFAYQEDLTANIPTSSLSDNYIEFGKEGARKAGERKFAGLVIE